MFWAAFAGESPPPCATDPGAGLLLARQLDVLAAHLAGPRDRAAPPRTELPRVYGWLVSPAGRRRVKCPLDSGASHCFLGRALAAQLPISRRRTQAGHPPAVRQADGSLRETGGAAMAQLLLGGLDEETAFVEFDVDFDARSQSSATTDCARTTSTSFTNRMRSASAPSVAAHRAAGATSAWTSTRRPRRRRASGQPWPVHYLAP